MARLSPLWPLAVVAGVDLWRFGLDGPEWAGWINVAAGWLVPYTLGAAWSRGRSPGADRPCCCSPGEAPPPPR